MCRIAAPPDRRPLLGALGFLLALVLLLSGPVPAAMADGIEYHTRFEAQCGRCHGHSGPFARDRLEIVDGRLVGRGTVRPVESFLRRHPGGLSEADIEMYRQVMYRQVEAGGVFADRCAVCHGRAVELAAAHLALANDVLLIRYRGIPVEDFLKGHGRLEAREIDIVYRALRDIVETR